MPDQLTPRCPAAEYIAGVTPDQNGIVCRVLQREGGTQDGITEGRGHEHLLISTDPSTVLGFCCGSAMAPMSLEGEPRAHYAFCPIWQQEQERIAERKRRAWESKAIGQFPTLQGLAA